MRSTFNLPDLGEGLPEAEIVRWHVREGERVEVDQPLVSVETAKAVVDVPSPLSGQVLKLHAQPGATVLTGKPLVDFETAAAPPERPAPQAAAPASEGMVVGHMASSNEEFVERAIIGSARRQAPARVRAAPAVRMLAKRLGVDLAACAASGRRGLVGVDDVLARANLGPARAAAPRSADLTDADRLRGARKAMAQSMSASRDEIALCTIFDDADVESWRASGDITARLIRAIVAAVRVEPGLNAWFDPSGPARKVLPQIHLAIAVDTPEGLIVPVLRDVGSRSPAALREQLNELKRRTHERSVTPEEMRGYTFTLSNFGTMAGRYATPLVVPPTVAILGAGRLQRDVIAGAAAPEIHARLPLSLSFDHRCITGAEACRFLAAIIADLQADT